MNLSDIIKNRYSVREYKATKVEKEILLEILEAGRLAPSAVNFQPWHFVVVQDKEMLSKLYNCYDRSWFSLSTCNYCGLCRSLAIMEKGFGW